MTITLNLLQHLSDNETLYTRSHTEFGTVNVHLHVYVYDIQLQL